jgi:pSer/pThr/pTyr-binding forkhead associated (FHA) protein
MEFPALIRIGGNEKIIVDRPSILIGRSRKRVDFQIDDPTGSSVHCELNTDQSGLTVRDLSRHGTLVNGRKVDSVSLHEGDIVEIAGFRFQVRFAGIAASAPQVPVKDEWLVRLAGMELGPMPWDELVGMAQRFELQQEDLVRPVSSTEWQSAGKQKRLFETVESQSSESAEVESTHADEADVEGNRTLDDDSHDDGLIESDPLDANSAKEDAQEDNPPTVSSLDDDDSKHDDDSAVMNFDEFAEDEVAAVTDEAATQPTFRLDDSGRDPRDPMGDTMLPTQAGTVTEARVFREAVGAADALTEETQSEARSGDDLVEKSAASEDSPPVVKVDAEKLPQSGWRYRHNGAEFGPVDLDGLSELAMAALLLPEDSVRHPRIKPLGCGQQDSRCLFSWNGRRLR